MIEKISDLLTGDKTLFLIDDIIANETLDKHRQPLLELVISGRHSGHSLQFLIISEDKQKCSTFGIQEKKTDLNTIHEENDIIVRRN